MIKDLISVIIPAYNAAKHIKETLQSVLSQTYPNIEILVIDDGSTDNTKQIVKSFGAKVRYYYQENSGPSAARNKGVKEAKGKYIAFIDSDDLWCKTALEKMMVSLKENHSDLVFSNALISYENGSEEIFWVEKPSNQNIFSNLIFENFLLMNCLVNKEIFKRVGPFDETLKKVEDFDFWLKAAKAGCKFSFINEPLFIYKKHAESASFNKEEMLLNLIEVYKKWQNLEKDKRTKVQIKESIGKTYYILGKLSLIKGPYNLKSSQYFRNSFMISKNIKVKLFSLLLFLIAPIDPGISKKIFY